MDRGTAMVASVSWFGVFVVAIGVLWLLDVLDYYNFRWAVAGAIAVIALGLSMIFNRWRVRSGPW
jgi:hypothetical protein